MHKLFIFALFCLSLGFVQSGPLQSDRVSSSKLMRALKFLEKTDSLRKCARLYGYRTCKLASLINSDFVGDVNMDDNSDYIDDGSDTKKDTIKNEGSICFEIYLY